jgi:hypothetical protein
VIASRRLSNGSDKGATTDHDAHHRPCTGSSAFQRALCRAFRYDACPDRLARDGNSLALSMMFIRRHVR